jgi:predicted transglutaminase-like protease
MAEGDRRRRKMLNKFKTALVLIGKKQFLPTDTDIKNVELKKLAKRLEGKSEKETLTNILEWQDRNIQSWKERGILELPGYVLMGLSIILYVFALLPVLFLFYYYLASLNILSPSASLLIVLTIFLLFMAWLLYQNTIVKIIYILLFSYPIYTLERAYLALPLQKSSTIDMVLALTSLNGVLCGAAALTIFYLVMSYRPIFRGNPFKTKASKIWGIMNNTFRISLPIHKILEYRMAICRDYAKLTASLLFSIHPNSKVYFLTIPRHVASAVKIDGKYYILDQKLPVLTKNGWLNRWNQKDAGVYVINPTDMTFNWHEQINRKSKREIPKVCTEELTERIAKILGIKQSSQKDEPFEIPPYGYAIYYDDDEITKYSLIRAIKNTLESELCGSIDKVSKIEISQNGNEKDLIVKVYFNSEPILRPQ